jgi:hypothetical protein
MDRRAAKRDLAQPTYPAWPPVERLIPVDRFVDWQQFECFDGLETPMYTPALNRGEGHAALCVSCRRSSRRHRGTHVRDRWRSITGTHYYRCESGDVPLAVSIQRYVSPGVWTTVASGTGETTYFCNGSTYLELYKVGPYQFWDHCD